MAQVTKRYGRPWVPRADIYETEDNVTIQLDLPGVNADQIDIQCEKGMLSIKGERQFNGETAERKYFRVENVYGPFERYFEIPRTLDTNKVEAKYRDGVLTLSFPKMEEAKPKKIDISIDS
ncbi:Hsp20 family protein [candidate division KSB3 bacterium]|uniref:Hsp20 family protein n=1 Tax=candidate division KSB3 bacterium TaxID=2044937 RepID=A0A9D5JT69_9BACT|nr:Hsp20 family protein [candidate division KSB3 bacterium]MBD3323799.1 Hsp20 family protein [candidate division KSB3 bacterium]